MTFETWWPYFLTCLAITMTPGPITALTISLTLRSGMKRSLSIIPGALLGDAIALSLSLTGVGLFMSQFPSAFPVMKAIGAVVLFLMGVWIIRSAKASREAATAPKDMSPLQIAAAGFSLAVLHPMSFVFFIAFAPQFLDASSPFMGQAVVMIVTFLVIAGFCLFTWSFLTHKLKQHTLSDRLQFRLETLSGFVLILLSLLSMLSVFR